MTYIKSEKGITVIDISISIVIITIFIALLGNLVIYININSKKIERKTTATSYAIQTIEKIKVQGYKEEYNGKGIDKEDELLEDSTDIAETTKFAGYDKKVSIKDYVLIKNDKTKKQDILKEITVEVSYKVGGKVENIKISTYVTKNK